MDDNLRNDGRADYVDILDWVPSLNVPNELKILWQRSNSTSRYF